MKKLLFVLLGLTSLNVYAADPLMMQPEAHCKTIRHYVSMATIPTVRHLVSTNKNSLRKLLISMFLQNTVLGQLMQKLVSQQMLLMPHLLKLQKKVLLRPVNKGDEMHLVKYLLQSGTAVSPLLKENLAKN